MKITKQQLKQIIKEELVRLSENQQVTPTDRLISRLRGEEERGPNGEKWLEPVWGDEDFAKLAAAYKVIEGYADDVYGASFDPWFRDQQISGNDIGLTIDVAKAVIAKAKGKGSGEGL